jgi:GTP-binding protein
VVGTKADKLSNNQLAKSVAALKRVHEVEEVLTVSAEKGTGVGKLWQRIHEVGEI